MSFANTYFETFLNNVNLEFSINFLLLGVPSILPESLAFIVNIEIMMLNFFLFNARKKKQLPLMINFNQFIAWHRKHLCKNKNYMVKFKRVVFDPG